MDFNTSIIYISDYLYKNNHDIAKIINTIIDEKKISIVLFEGDHISIFDSNLRRFNAASLLSFDNF